MDNPLKEASSVPVWVWLGVIVVVFLAFSSHTASTTPTATPVDDGSAAATSNLQQAQLAAQTAVGLRILDIAGAEDISRIQARTQEQTNNTALAAITAQAQGNVDQINASQPPQPININITRGTNTATAQSFAKSSALMTSRIRSVKRGILEVAPGDFGGGISYGSGL